MQFKVFDGVEGHVYKQKQGGENGSGWTIGVPYPGIQILTPIPLDAQVVQGELSGSYQSRELGIPIQVESAHTVRLRDVPAVKEIDEALQQDSEFKKTLAYALEDRPSKAPGIIPVPVRFLGGWGKLFMPRLLTLLRHIQAPEGRINSSRGRVAGKPLKPQPVLQRSEFL